jgi:hypothetical protein
MMMTPDSGGAHRYLGRQRRSTRAISSWLEALPAAAWVGAVSDVDATPLSLELDASISRTNECLLLVYAFYRALDGIVQQVWVPVLKGTGICSIIMIIISSASIVM